jgi:glycosidase
MKRLKMIIAVVLTLAVIASAAVVSTSVSAAEVKKTKTSAGGITVHCYSESGVPNIYYWNSLPQNIETQYPGPAMSSEGKNWYKYSFSNVTKINMLFVTGGVQSEELTQNTGEWWYKDGTWYSELPGTGVSKRTDMREDSIYFVITTRFFDGDKSNNVHCSEDKKANNPDSDPAWRGDFKGLIQKLDYIKALGFSAIWITPIVENRSGYDYHGYHGYDFSKVDSRYESSGATYQDLIKAAHAKGIKIIQDVVFNHSCNWGEKNLLQLNSDNYPTRNQVVMNGNGDPDNIYHHTGFCGGGDWDNYEAQRKTIADDCFDFNTENPKVSDYLVNCYNKYINMGVDAFRVDTVKHISRLTLNKSFIPQFKKTGGENFYMFGEVCTKGHDVWYRDAPPISCAFYTWADDSTWLSKWTNNALSNVTLTESHYNAHLSTGNQPTSNNHLLNGVQYHKPDYSKRSGLDVIDFQMHWAFNSAGQAYAKALDEDGNDRGKGYFNDSTWNVTYVDSHDYGPDESQTMRYNGGEQAWAENMDLLFTFRGVPCLFYGSETQFMAGKPIDVGPNAPLSATGRAYYGDNIEGSVSATDFGKYTASGAVQSTLNKPLAQHVRKLNMIRRAVPALQKGQYKTVGGGGMSFIRRYTANGVDSLACVAISGGGNFSGIPNGTYIDAVTGDKKTVSGGSLSVSGIGKGNMRVYVCCASGFKGISGKIGDSSTYLK